MNDYRIEEFVANGEEKLESWMTSDLKMSFWKDWGVLRGHEACGHYRFVKDEFEEIYTRSDLSYLDWNSALYEVDVYDDDDKDKYVTIKK